MYRHLGWLGGGQIVSKIATESKVSQDARALSEEG